MATANKRIFVPFDFSRPSLAALRYAVYIANRVDAEIDLIHILPKDAVRDSIQVPSDYKKKLSELRKSLYDIRNKSGAAFRIQEKVVTTPGSVLDKIIDVGESLHAEMACIGTYGTDAGKKHFHLGSNTVKLVRTASFPVLSCRDVKKPLRFKNLLLPIDLTKYTQEKVERIIRFGQSFDSVINLVAVSEFFEELTNTRSELIQRMEEAAAHIREAGLKCTTEVIRHDMVTNSVLLYAGEIHADLLVIMSAHENIFNQLLLGSRVNKILSQAEIPVLSFRPAHYQK